MACPVRDTVLQHPRVGTQFDDIPGSERSFTTGPDRDAVIQYSLVAMQFHGMHRSGLMACTGRDAV